MLEKEKFIQEVYDAIWTEIQEYDYAHNTKEGLLEYLQGYTWKFDQNYVINILAKVRVISESLTHKCI